MPLVYFKALSKLTGQLVASHLAIKLLTLSLKTYSVCQHLLGFDCSHLFKQDVSLQFLMMFILSSVGPVGTCCKN